MTAPASTPSCAEFLAKRGALVEIATQDRMVAEEVGATNQPIHLRELYKLGVVLSPNLQLTEIYREGSKLVAVLRNEFTHEEEERLVDQIVVEFQHPAQRRALFRPEERSINRGEMDLTPSSKAARSPTTNGHGGSALYRIGDGVRAATSTRRSTTPPACARTCESPMIASTLSAIVIITLASGWRWRWSRRGAGGRAGRPMSIWSRA